ncbi:MAG: heat-inducible transcription repressor HrcA [Calditrichaceae bacterium]|nr:heat-inducible transcription repressor HrcA [Calditrichaceae bacterium]MBN2710451.1 heat-inducible transcription repressor HrcA [Calditrichaceae bacterium]RQV93613.1 MAG: heat-inducible transcription repressor HrcA [Calditrichota bacterium]
MVESITYREKSILKELIHKYILTANPVGSNQIALNGDIGLKSASVRRIMSGLEEKGFVFQPHTSAGRVPTTAGYRLYVNELMTMDKINPENENEILDSIESSDGDFTLLMKSIAGVLARLSSQLGVIVSPKFEQGVFEKIHIIPVSSDKYMIVISVKDGQVKTIIIEHRQRINQSAIKRTVNKINQRLHGKTLMEIKNHFPDVMSDLKNEESGLVRLFSETAEKLFDFKRYDNYTINGTSNILQKPEFINSEQISTLIELLEDKNIIIHFMGERETPPGIKVTIGDEHLRSEIKECSVITSTYRIGGISGILGIIGPTRMPYQKMIPLIQFTADAITSSLNS